MADKSSTMTEEGVKQLKIDEGFRDHVYVDTEGHLTTGWGHKLTAKDVNKAGKPYKEGDKIDTDILQNWFKNDVKSATSNAKGVIGKEAWSKLDYRRQDALSNMAFNLGEKGLSGFKNTIKAIKNEQWETAGKEMKDSKWYNQVGNRADRLIEKMNPTTHTSYSNNNRYPSNGDAFPEQMSAADTLGGIELSLQNVDISNLYGLNFNAVTKTVIMLNLNKAKSSSLTDKDSILKKKENCDSIMLWQHFCSFLQMFYEHGDRESVSFSLDPDEVINKNESEQNVRMKKVYYPEQLRWTKAGEVMFDADVFIKTLLYDLHPDITQHIPNYQSYVHKVLQSTGWNDDSQSPKNDNWHRLWIVLDTIQQTEDGNSVIIDNIRFKINVRKMYVDNNGELQDDTSCNENGLLMEFVNHINQNMEILHEHSLLLQRLEGVFRALVSAKFVYNHNIPFNQEIIKEVCGKQKQELTNFGLIFTMPSLVRTVKKEREIRQNNHLIKQSRQHTFSGGIDLNVELNKVNNAQLKAKLNSTNKVFAGVNNNISKLQYDKQFKQDTRAAFKSLCNATNNKQQYTAILFPTMLFEEKKENLLQCEMEDCKEILSWQPKLQFDEKNLCQMHYEQIRHPKCSKCHETIDRLHDKEYRKMKCDPNELILHGKCCNCFHCCKTLDENMICVTDTHNGCGFGLYCNQDCFYQHKDVVKKCVKCQKNINTMNDTNIIQTKHGDLLHAECFQCTQCQKILDITVTISDANNNVFCCEECVLEYNGYPSNVIKKCCECQKEINLMKEKNVRQMDDDFIHAKCLKCTGCQCILGNKFITDKQKNRFCSSQCAEKEAMQKINKDGKKMSCHKCKANIVVSNGVITMNNGMFLHPACLVCYQCNERLKNVVMDNDQNLFCSGDCGKRYHQH